MRIGCVSDVCLGYGSPQIGYLVESLADHYGDDAEILVVEPGTRDLPPRHNFFPRFRIRRASTVFDPYSGPGRTEYALGAAQIMNDWAPDLLVICCTYTLPVLFKLRKRPAYVIYYCYESIAHYGDFDVEMNRQLEGRLDVVLFPEENRAALEMGRFRFGVPALVLYNCPRRTSRPPLSREVRNGRFLYAGMIDRVNTFADYYSKPLISAYPIDLFGPIRAASEDERAAWRESLKKRVQYGGHVANRDLAELRRHYIYSLVMWNPRNENQLYAAPNKFFESIADGVPPLSAPHPQCKKLIERYRCGVLTTDWSEAGLLVGMDRATKLYETSEWDSMVANCHSAFIDDLNWERQFEKLRVHLTK
jgi:hypothetical protein